MVLFLRGSHMREMLQSIRLALNVRSLLKEHPVGLNILFRVLSSERFGHYALQAILVIYLYTEEASGGLGWTKAEAFTTLGFYNMLIYVCCFPISLLVDKYITKKQGIYLGNWIIMSGHITMALPLLRHFGIDWFSGEAVLWPALSMIAIGVGFQKPAANAQLAAEYDKHEREVRKNFSGEDRVKQIEIAKKLRNQGFTLFYVGINIGGGLAALLVGILKTHLDFHAGFTLAAFGMFISQWYFVRNYDKLECKVEKKDEAEAEENLDIPGYTREQVQRLRYWMYGFICFSNLFFWSAFLQGAGLINAFANDFVNRAIPGFAHPIPTAWFQGINPILVVFFGLGVELIWTNRGKEGKRASTPFKMGTAVFLLGIAFALMYVANSLVVFNLDGTIGKVSPAWILGTFVFITLAELCLSPVGWSVTSKLVPKRHATKAQGFLLAISGTAGYFSGQIGKLSEVVGRDIVFGTLCVVLVVVGLGTLAVSDKLKKLSCGSDDDDPTYNELLKRAN